MSKSEDYLDGLLNSALGKTEPEITSDISDTEDERKETVPDMPKSENDFLDEFERELMSDGEDEEFLRQFEQELEGGEKKEETSDSGIADREAFLDNLDGIVNSVKEKLEAEENQPELQMESAGASEAGLDGLTDTEPDGDGMDIMVDTLGDFSGTDLFTDGSEEQESISDSEGGDDLMSLLQSEGSFGDTEPAEDGQTDEDAFADLEEEGKKGKKKRRKKKNKRKKEQTDADAGMEPETESGKPGFFQRLSRLLFGEDEEEEKKEEIILDAGGEGIQELTDENIELLAELDGMEQAAVAEQAAPVGEEKGKKKKEKKEKKPKKEKTKKEKKPKPKKEKKPKPPKEPDLTPPLPKVPVILVFVMAGSFLALVLLGTNLFGYSYHVKEAKAAYNLGDYEAAYQSIYGLEVKEKDSELYEKCLIMANVSGEFSAYQTFLEADLYDMALDSLVRAIGRCEKYLPDAEEYGCREELERLESTAEGALGVFGMSKEEALTLYDISGEREEYSTELYRILKNAGYEVAE